MIFNDITVDVNLLTIGGLDALLDGKSNSQIINFERTKCLNLIKNDLKIMLGKSDLDFDFIATNYDYLIIEALKCLQRYQMLIIYADVNMEIGNAKTQAENCLKDYELIKKKFTFINLSEKQTVTNISQNSVYL